MHTYTPESRVIVCVPPAFACSWLPVVLRVLESTVDVFEAQPVGIGLGNAAVFLAALRADLEACTMPYCIVLHLGRRVLM